MKLSNLDKSLMKCGDLFNKHINRLKCSICSEAKISSIWAQEGSGNVQKNSVT